MVWFIGRHNQGFHFADTGVASAFGEAVLAVLVDMGMTSDSLKRFKAESLRKLPEG
jgi:hypothetical protein